MNKINPKRLKEARTSKGHGKGWSRQQLSNQSEISGRQIARIESSEADVMVRATTAERLAQALGISVERLAGDEPIQANQPSLPDGLQFTVKVDIGVQFAYDMIRRKYGPSRKDVIRLAPVLFVLLAERSLEWRRQRLKEVEEAIERVRKVSEGSQALYFTNQVWRVEEGCKVEQESIEQGDFLADLHRQKMKNEPHFMDDESLYKANPFCEYLNKVAMDLGLEKDIRVDWDESPWGSYVFLYYEKFEEIVGDSEEAFQALAYGDVRLSEIPKELMPERDADERKDERIQWLEDKLSDKTRKYIKKQFDALKGMSR